MGDCCRSCDTLHWAVFKAAVDLLAGMCKLENAGYACWMGFSSQSRFRHGLCLSCVQPAGRYTAQAIAMTGSLVAL